MNHLSEPVEIPLIGNVISKAVQAFAQSKSLDYELWYHDEPIWIVRKESPKNFFKHVQVAAFDTADGEKLCFVPKAYGFGEGTNLSTSPDPSSVKRISLRELSQKSDPDITADVKNFLDSTWSKASNFKKSDLKDPF